jgi:thioredoxin reductase (NADPH)
LPTDDQIAFPELGPELIEQLMRRGRARDVSRGTVLFAEGDRGFCFYVVLEGALQIVERSSDTEREVITHGERHFSGDVDMLSGRPALVTARMKTDGRVLELSAKALREAVDALPDFGQIVVRAFLMRRELLLSEHAFQGVRIIGSRFSRDAHRLRDFASRNGIPFRFMDLETDAEAEAVLRSLGVPPSRTPIVVGLDGEWAENPSNREFADCAGLTRELPADHVYDLVVVGAGPAGLAAAVYAASEGLDTLALDAVAAGGQAGTSARIENYLGFPTGISGSDLTKAARIQAEKFGAQLDVSKSAVGLRVEGGERVVVLDDGSEVRTRCVLIATGVDYRRLDVAGLGAYEGAGVYYAATEMEARLCRNEDVVVVGGGNSAGQAIVHLGRSARHVHVLVRGADLGASMSRYLVSQVEGMPNVTVHRRTQVTRLDGNGRLSRVWAARAGGEPWAIETSALFLFIGAAPRTEWLSRCVAVDAKGFVLTGESLPAAEAAGEPWRMAGRAPYLLETNLPGVFAAGDVRSGSVKRVASSVGEGSMAITFVHAHLARPA